MSNITIRNEYSEREELVYCFTLISDVYQSSNYYPNNQLPKLIADIQKDLRTELKEFLYLLPLFCHRSYKLSLFSNCLQSFIPSAEGLALSPEDLIARVLTDDPNELTARVFMTVDNNAHDILFYRKLISESLVAVKHCLEMDIEEELRTVLLSLLVERKGYHAKMTSFAFKTLDTLRGVFRRRSFVIKKVLSLFNNGNKAVEALLEFGCINADDNVIIIPVLLNPALVYTYSFDGIKCVKMGFDFEQLLMKEIGSHRPTLELELIGKIFGDPTRCEIIRTLKSNGSYLTDLARRLQIPTNSLHYHIQALSDAGVINGNYTGKRFVYELNPQFFNSAGNTLMQFFR